MLLMNSSSFTVLFLGGWLLAPGFVAAGPYSAALDDPTNPHDAPVPGFIGRHGIGKARLQTGVDENGDPVFQNPDNQVNPLFFAWAGSVVDYNRADGDLSFSDPSRALGEVTGDNFDAVSLGDLTAGRIAAGNAAGSITLELARPVRNLSGADFVVFENGLVAQSNTGGAGPGGILAELAYVEVSSNGLDFVRFPATSLTPSAVGGYGSISATNVHNLAGKHVNSYATSWGTPFDLAQVGLQEVTHVRLVDIPGDGSFKDRAGSSIYDAWLTFGSGGFDLEAVGVISSAMTYDQWPPLRYLAISQRGAADDPDGDGLPNLLEYAFGRSPWQADAGGAGPSFREMEFCFTRDERLVDLTYSVQVSGSLASGSWTTLASSVGGTPLQAAAGKFPIISDFPASAISSIGVVREVRIREASPGPQRYFRIEISRTP